MLRACVKYVPKQSHCVALWTRTLSKLWACVSYVLKQRTFCSTLNTKVFPPLGMCESMYRSSPFRSTLNTWSQLKFGHVLRSIMNTNLITDLGMCKVFTEAVHSVARWTRTLSQPWACVKYVPEQPIHSTLSMNVITALGMCKICTEAVLSVALWTRRFSQLWACVKYVPKQPIP